MGKIPNSIWSVMGGGLRQIGGIAIDEYSREASEHVLICPVCGFNCAHITGVQKDDPRGWGNYGNVSIEIWGECGHRWTIFFNSHKGAVIASTSFDRSMLDRPPAFKTIDNTELESLRKQNADLAEKLRVAVHSLSAYARCDDCSQHILCGYYTAAGKCISGEWRWSETYTDNTLRQGPSEAKPSVVNPIENIIIKLNYAEASTGKAHAFFDFVSDLPLTREQHDKLATMMEVGIAGKGPYKQNPRLLTDLIEFFLANEDEGDEAEVAQNLRKLLALLMSDADWVKETKTLVERLSGARWEYDKEAKAVYNFSSSDTSSGNVCFIESCDEDGQFIAAARNVVPSLLAEINRLSWLLDVARHALEDHAQTIIANRNSRHTTPTCD